MSADNREIGIASVGLKLPSLSFSVEKLAALRGEDPNKFTIGLGCSTMALCNPEETVVDLAAAAAERALASWGQDKGRIGLFAVGTETAMDMSRPLSAWVADRLGLSGHVRSYEVKHACYGGTLALRQAVEWQRSGAAQDKAALVIAADVALYAPKDPGEPTQGAGAAAFVIDAQAPVIARIGIESYPYSEPAFDFWRPVGEAYPRVEGKFSLECYQRAVENTFSKWCGPREAKMALQDVAAICFHVPFPKMVWKSAVRLGQKLGLSDAEVSALWEEKIQPFMTWNKVMGNAYTASLWFSVSQALATLPPGSKILAFSYGSGFGSELFEVEACDATSRVWKDEFEADVAHRREITIAEYEALRQAPGTRGF